MITDQDLRDITKAFIDIANKTGVLDDVLAEYEDDRSLGVRIIGSKLNIGFIFKNGRLRMMSELDKPTVLVTMDKETYWYILNSENGNIARARIYTGVFTEESITVDPPPGVEGGMLHIENIIKIFSEIAKFVMG